MRRILDDTDIRHGIGDDEAGVMSQKATTEAISESVKELPRSIERIAATEKRLTNLEQAITPSPFLVDDTAAYSKTVPANALPYAEIKEVGGVTRKCTNLIPYPYEVTTKTTSGVTFTDNGDGSITVNGTSTAKIYYQLNNVTYRANKTYVLHGCPSGGSVNAYRLYDDIVKTIDTGEGAVYSSTEKKQGRLYIFIESGVTVTNLVFKPTLNESSTALPFETYFSGLQSAPVTEIKSYGTNVLNIEGEKWGEDGWFTTNHDGSAIHSFAKSNYEFTSRGNHINITSYDNTGYLWLSRFVELEPNCTYRVRGSNRQPFRHIFGINDTAVGARGTLLINSDGVFNSGDYKYWMISFYGTGSSDIIISRGAEEKAFSPYKSVLLPIPAAIRNLDGYGWSVSDSAYNYVDFEKKQFVKRVERVDMGTLQWVYDSSSRWKTFDIAAAVKTDTFNPPLLAEKYPTSRYWNNEEGAITMGDENTICIMMPSDSPPPTGMLYFELAEPIVEDISDKLPLDNYIEVFEGGSLIMENENKLDVPSTITYQIKEVSNES